MQEIIEGFAVETKEGLIFAVKGLLHPPDRVIAYLRYVPDAEGNREREGVRYRRVYHFDEQRSVLQARYPVYLYHDDVLGFQVQGVPRPRIRTVYDPSRFLATLRERGPADPVERDALGLASLVQSEAGVGWESLGLSGSVMLGTYQPECDVDLMVYGGRASAAVHRALLCLLDDPDCPVRRPNQAELALIHAAHRHETPLSLADFCRHQRRKVNEGRFCGREYFVRFVERPAESGRAYGEHRFEALGHATVRFRVVDDRDVIFTPCRYVVDEVCVLSGRPVPVEEIVSYRGRFSEQARVGERGIARGGLERVISGHGPAHYRLVVGGQAGDFLVAEEETCSSARTLP